ncbi:4'-phosphopantetheinyl transferase family protein [Shivajiella indica]|uniref:4'-phosphopantetheinyl transferase family protein n=1 Tax=Shivajiella indica TaxID=872115 RepID=A0ABW5BA41_9BACT
MDTNSSWQKGLPKAKIQNEIIHVWTCSLDLAKSLKEDLERTLSPDEMERAGRFYFERDQDRFIVSRGSLRQILGIYLQQEPALIKFEYSEFGKPLLKSDSNSSGICFNISHSENLALIAISEDVSLGVDIERIRYDMDINQVMARFFTKEEIRIIESLDSEKRNEKFFQLWTRKEAFLKATGKGLSLPMELCDVSSVDDSGFSQVKVPVDLSDKNNWFVMDLGVGEGFAAAVGTDKAEMGVIIRNFSLD